MGQMLGTFAGLLYLAMIGTLGYQAWDWFNLGVWNTISLASLTGDPYAPITQYLGFNKILDWFWHGHINYVLLPLSIIVAMIAGIFEAMSL